MFFVVLYNIFIYNITLHFLFSFNIFLLINFAFMYDNHGEFRLEMVKR